MRAILFTLMSVVSAVALCATVYKWVDENGVTHYSDQPHENAEKVQIAQPQTYSAPATFRPLGAGTRCRADREYLLLPGDTACAGSELSERHFRDRWSGDQSGAAVRRPGLSVTRWRPRAELEWRLGHHRPDRARHALTAGDRSGQQWQSDLPVRDGVIHGPAALGSESREPELPSLAGNLRAPPPLLPLVSAQCARHEPESRSTPRELAPWRPHGH